MKIFRNIVISLLLVSTVVYSQPFAVLAATVDNVQQEADREIQENEQQVPDSESLENWQQGFGSELLETEQQVLSSETLENEQQKSDAETLENEQQESDGEILEDDSDCNCGDEDIPQLEGDGEYPLLKITRESFKDGEGYDGKAYYDWVQKMAKHTNLFRGGCRIVSFAKMLYEAGYTEIDPDKLYEWGTNNKPYGHYYYFGADRSPNRENGDFGLSVFDYAAANGGSAKIAESKLDIGGYSKENSEYVMECLRKGYYVILSCVGHTAYVAQEESLEKGYPVIYDTTSNTAEKYRGRYGTIVDWEVYTAYKFNNIRAFSIEGPPQSSSGSFKQISETEYCVNGKTYNINNPSFVKTELASGLTRYTYVNSNGEEISVYKGVLEQKGNVYGNYFADSEYSYWTSKKITAIYDFSLVSPKYGSLCAGSYADVIYLGNNFKTSGLTSAKGMFEYSKVTHIDVSGLDTSSVTDMEDMFRTCRSLESIDLSNFDITNVSNMEYMFAFCDNLKEITFGKFDTSNVKWTLGMLQGCKSLEKIDLSGFDFKNKTSSANLGLSTCDSLNEIYTPRNVKTGCGEYLPGNDGKSKVTYFYDSKGIAYTKLPENLSESILLKRGTQVPGSPEVDYGETAITFDPCGGRIYDFDTGTISRTAVKTYFTDPKGRIPKFPMVDKAGKAFAGWYTEPEGGVKIDENHEFTPGEKVYAHYVNLKGCTYFDMEKDVFGFLDEYGGSVNNSSGKHWNYKYFSKVLNAASTGEKGRMGLIYAANVEGALTGRSTGWCYGLATMMGLLYMGKINPGWVGSNTVFNIKHSDEIDALITYYFFQQCIGRDTYVNKLGMPDYASQQLVERLLHYNEPLIVSFKTSETSSHTLMAYAIDAESDDEFYYVYAADPSCLRMVHRTLSNGIKEYLDEAVFPMILKIRKSDYHFVGEKSQNGLSDNKSSLTKIIGVSTIDRYYDLKNLNSSGIVSTLYSSVETVKVAKSSSGSGSGGHSGGGKEYITLNGPFYINFGTEVPWSACGKYYIEGEPEDYEIVNDANSKEYFAIEYLKDDSDTFVGAFTDASTINVTGDGCVTVEGASEDSEVFTTVECGETAAVVQVRSDNTNIMVEPGDAGVDISSDETLGTIYVSVDEGEEKAMNVSGTETSIVPEFNINLDVNGGKPLAETDYQVDIYTQIDELPVPVKDGAVFMGWYTDAVDGSNMADVGHFYEDATLYAHWETDRIDSVSLSLAESGNIGLNFYMYISDDVANGGYVSVTNPRQDYTVNCKNFIKQSDGTYKVSYSLSATEMNTPLTVSAFNSKGEKVKFANNGTDNGDIVYSIKKYVDAVRSDRGADYALKQLVDSMYNYGQLAQIYFDYYPSEGAGAFVNEVDLEEYSPVWKGQLPSGIEYEGSSLLLQSETGIKHYFSCSGNISDYTFMVDGKTVQPRNVDGKYVIKLDGVPVAKLGTANHVKVIDNASGQEAELEYSAMSYCYRAVEISDDKNLIDLVKGLAEYYDDARLYWGRS